MVKGKVGGITAADERWGRWCCRHGERSERTINTAVPSVPQPTSALRSYAGFVSGDQLVSHAIQMRGIAGCEVLPVTGTVVFSQRQVLC